MCRRWLRLVSCVCMVAYALTNTHLNLAWSQYLLTKPVASESAATDDSKPSGCKHCASKAKPGNANSEKQPPSKPCSDCPSCPSGPGCPCCPNGDNSCPVPGGCSMCSVAKAPCLTHVPAFQPFVSPVGESTIERPIAYVPPSHASLIRPPRI